MPKKDLGWELGVLWLFARERRGGRVNPTKLLNFK